MKRRHLIGLIGGLVLVAGTIVGAKGPGRKKFPAPSAELTPG